MRDRERETYVNYIWYLGNRRLVGSRMLGTSTCPEDCVCRYDVTSGSIMQLLFRNDSGIYMFASLVALYCCCCCHSSMHDTSSCPAGRLTRPLDTALNTLIYDSLWAFNSLPSLQAPSSCYSLPFVVAMLHETECRLCGWIGAFICGRSSGSSIKSSADFRTLLLLPELFCSHLSIRFYCDSSASYECTWPAHLCTTCGSIADRQTLPTLQVSSKSPLPPLDNVLMETRQCNFGAHSLRVMGGWQGRRAMQRTAREPRTFCFKLALLLLGPGEVTSSIFRMFCF